MKEYVKKINILSVSQSLLYEGVPHAGGKTYAYYMKAIAEDPDFSLSIVCFCVKGEESKAEFEKFHANGTLLFSKGSFLVDARRALMDVYGMLTGKTHLDSYYKHCEYLRILKKLKKEGYQPDIIILEWTCCVSLAGECRELFPNAKIVGSEHDVTLLAAERKAALYSGLRKRIRERTAQLVKKEELDAISCCDVVMPHNHKDAALLAACGVPEEKIHEIVPYFHDMSGITRRPENKDIIFWGAMSREENSSAALWFLDHVFPQISDPDVRFVIIGNNPPEKLEARANSRVIVTGFVEDPVPYFEKSMCFAAPLLSGAGIKVKIIEALSSGLPVLTNEIGIEGIPAEDGKDFFFCESPEDYRKAIEALAENKIDTENLSKNARSVIKNHFNMESSKAEYLAMLKGLHSARVKHSPR